MASDPFPRLAHVLRGLAAAVAERPSGRVPWTPDSPAGVAAAATGYADEWGERPLREPGVYGLMLLTFLADLLRGMAATVDADAVIYSPMTLVRPTLEAGGQAFYQLEPNLDDVERIRRGMNVALVSLVEQLNMASGYPGNAESIEHFRDRIRRLEASAQRLDALRLRPEKASHPPAKGLHARRWLGTKPPSDQRLISDLLAGDEDDRHIGPLLHRLSSGVMHAQQHGLMSNVLMSHLERGDEGLHAAPVGVSFGDLVARLGGVVWGTDRLMMRACAFYGWPDDEWRQSVLPLLIEWRAWLPATT